MPHQYQDSVVADYTTPLTVPATTEVITQAALRDMALGLANRIAFTRALFEADQDQHAKVRDDFLHVDEGAVAFGTPRIWHGDTPWIVTQLAAGTLQLTSFAQGGDFRNHGILRVRSTSGTTGASLNKGPNDFGGGIRVEKNLLTRCFVRIGNLLAPMKFEVGIRGGAGNAINEANVVGMTFLFDPAVSPNWLARSSLAAGASSHLENTGVAPNGAFQRLDIIRLDEADPTYEWRINNTVVVTKQQSLGAFFIPSGTMQGHLGFAAQVPVFATNEQVDIDCVSFDLDSSGR